LTIWRTCRCHGICLVNVACLSSTMDSGSESDDAKPRSVLPDIAKNQVAASLWGPPGGKAAKIFDRLMAPVRQKADAASDFKFRAGAPPRMPRPEPQPQPLPVVPAPEETERKTGYRHWVAKTARPRLALRRLQVTQVGDKSEEKASKQRPRAGSTAAEAAFIQDVLGVDRTIVRGDDIRAELRGRVEELGELAKHRWDCRLHATRTSRRKAVQWRAQQIQRETLFRTRCRASIIVHQNPESYHDASGMQMMDKQFSNKVKAGASSQPLIMKGISCDTGILNVTFCPLMEETHSEEQEEEVTAIEPSPTPLIDEETEARPSLLRTGSSKRTLEPVPLDSLMDISFADEMGQDEKKKSVPKLLVTSAAGELFNQNRKKRRELNRRLREVRRKYKEKMKEESSEADNPVRSSYSIAGVPIEGMPNSSKAYLSQVSAFDEKTYRDVLRRFTDTDAIDQSDLREFLESVGFKPRNKPEREVMHNLLRNLDSLDIAFDVLFGEIIPAIRLGFAEIRSSDLVKRFHEADIDKSGVLSLIEMLQILRWSGFFPRLHIVVQAVLEVIPEIAEMSQATTPQALLEKDLIKPAQFHILAPLLEERAECENVQRRVEISENMDLDEETQKLWGSSLVDLHDVFLRRAKQDLLPYTSLHHLAFDCGLVQHRAPGFREKLRNIASGEVSPQMMEEGFDLHDPSAVERAHFDFRQVLRIMTQIRQIEVELIGDVFAATDADETNGLSVEECMDCLAACGIEPTTKQMQDLIPRLVEEFDEDGSGELDLEEYLEFAKFVADRIRKMQHVGNMDDAQRIGYGEEEYMRLWDAFVAADENMDCHLEEEELLVAVMHARPDAETSSSDLRAILKDQGINYWKQALALTMRDFLNIMKDVDQLQVWRNLGADKGVEKEAVEGFIGVWRMLSRSPKEDMVTPKELARAVKSLPGAQIKLGRIRYLQQIGFEWIDFSNFLQVMRKNGSELGDGAELAHLGLDPELLSPLQTPSDGGQFLLSPSAMTPSGSLFSQISPRPGMMAMKRGGQGFEEEI